MRTFYKLNEGKAETGSGSTVPEGFIEYQVGQEPDELKIALDAFNTSEATEKMITAWKENRQKLVGAIEVTHNGIIYQGDEKSQERINRAITGVSAMPVGSTIEWTAKDNTVHPLTKDDFIVILIDAGQQQSAIWNVGRP